MNEELAGAATQNEQDIHEPGERRRTSSNVVQFFQQYAHERPEVVALWCLGLGFVLGWKLKPW